MKDLVIVFVVLLFHMEIIDFRLFLWLILDWVSLHCSEGGYFNAIMTFPENYPNSPPSVRFTSEMWHPNGSLPELVSLFFFFMYLLFLMYA